MSNSWIHTLVEENSVAVETPLSWLYWSALCCISAAAANNFFLLSFKGTVSYFPNIYVMLLGESGIGKGYPTSFTKKLVTAADITRVIAGRSSIQAIVKELSQTKSEAGKPVILDSRGLIINGELSTAIIKDPDALTILTDLFDRNDHPTWTNMLKGDGHEKLKEPYVTCLFGSSPSHFYDSVPQVNIEGGYIGRNLVVYEETRSKNVDPLDSEDEEIDEDKFESYFAPKYSQHLIKISKIAKTRMYPNEKARILYNNWRQEWRNTQSIYNDKTGFVNRVPDHVIKIAMLLCLSRFDCNFIISESDIAEAVQKVTGLVYASQKAAEGSGLDPLAKQTKLVIETLMGHPEQRLTRKELLTRGYGNYEETILDKIIGTLLEMGWVKREKIGIGANMDWLIKLSGEPLKRLLEFRASSNGHIK